MRILFLADAVFDDLPGGSRVVARELACGLARRGHAVTILAARQTPQGPDDFKVGGVRVVRYAGAGNPINFVRGGRRACAQLWAEEPFDIVHTHFAYAAVGPLRAVPADAVRVRTFHGPWDEEGWLEDRRRGGPIGAVRAHLKRKLRRGVEAANLAGSAHVLTLSETFRRLAVDKYGVPEAKAETIPGGTDVARFRPAQDRRAVRAGLGLPADRTLLLSVRRLAPRMGLDNLIRALPAVVARIPDALLLIGGRGPERAALEALAAELGMTGHVRMLGFIPDADLAAHYQAADLFVLPTLALEGFGLVTAEALACGLAVVGTPVGATPEILGGLDDRLVAQGTAPEDLSRAILDYFRGDWAAELTPARLHGFVAGRYTWERHVAETEKAYLSLLGGLPPRRAARELRPERPSPGRSLPAPSGTCPLNTTISHTRFGGDTSLKRATDSKHPRRTILYLDHTAKMGGGEIALLNLVSALDRERYRPVVVLAAEGALVAKLRAAGVETLVEPLGADVIEARKDGLGLKSLLRVGQAWACCGYAFRLARLARRLGADLIHTNSLKADLYGGLAGRLAGIPVLWHVRDSIDGHYLPAPVAALFRGLSRVVPTAVVANSESTLRTLRMGRRNLTATVYSGVAPAAPALASLANSGEADMRRQVVHDGYDAQAFGPPQVFGFRRAPGAAPAAPAPAFVALVGRIADWKGQHVFIEAAALVRDRFPEARFQIIGAPLFGEHEYEASLHRQVAALGIGDRVAFLGFREDVPALLARADIVVHASTLGEPFGQVVIEGMAAGKPVIATDGGALPEIVLPGLTGLLVPMGDAPAMAEAMAALLSDPARASAMGAAGRERVRERFTIAHTVHRIEKIYEYLLREPGPVRHGHRGL